MAGVISLLFFLLSERTGTTENDLSASGTCTPPPPLRTSLISYLVLSTLPLWSLQSPLLFLFGLSYPGPSLILTLVPFGLAVPGAYTIKNPREEAKRVWPLPDLAMMTTVTS